MTARHTVNTNTSDALDQLYADLDQATRTVNVDDPFRFDAPLMNESVRSGFGINQIHVDSLNRLVLERRDIDLTVERNVLLLLQYRGCVSLDLRPCAEGISFPTVDRDVPTGLRLFERKCDIYRTILADPQRAGDCDVAQAIFAEIDAGSLLGQLEDHIHVSQAWKQSLTVNLMVPDNFVR
jgi:hypothetical protein